MKTDRPFLAAARALAVLPLALVALRAAPAPARALPARLDLKAAIDFALENNFSIRQARERIREQEGVVLEVKSQEIPNVAATGTYQRNDTSISQGFPASDRTWTAAVTATQVLYAGGGVRAGVRGAQLAREAAVLEMQGIVNSALLQVRTQFFNVLLAREKIKVQERNLELLESQLRDATNRFEAGTTSNFEKLRAEVALANGRVPLITARNDYRLAIEELRQTLGLTGSAPAVAGEIPEIVGSLQFTPVNYDLAAALTAAHERRPELQRLARLESASEEGVTGARAGYYPNLSLVGGWELRKGATNSFGDSNDGWLVALQSQWNIFDGRATAGRVAQARSLQEQARLQLSEQTLAVEVEVRRAFSSLQEATELAEASKKVVEQAEEAVRLANARYEAGTATQLDVLTSQVDLTTARTNQLQAYYGYNVAVASLRQAMGMADEYAAN